MKAGDRLRTFQPPLVFVYLGRELPEYTHASIRFSAKAHSGKTVLLTNASHQLSGCSAYEVEDFQSWYDPSHFQSFREKTTLDPHFRSGFWLHVVERFFVLRQYMQRLQLGGLFHAELDVMVFDLSEVAEMCDEHGTGIFAVMDDPSRALASLFYVNSSEKFDHFLSFALSQHDMKNEMEMIGSYLQQFPNNGHSLPSDRFFDRDAHPLSPSAVDDRSGLFDANAFGQWLFGLDPKNIKLTVKNHFWNPMARFPIDRLRFRLPFVGRGLTAEMPGGEKRRVRTLHVHSKIVPRLVFRPLLVFYLLINNFPFRWTVLRKKGWVPAKVLDVSLREKRFSLLRALHRLAPQLIEPQLLRAVSRAAVPLSSRQRTVVLSLLPEVGRLHSVDARLPSLFVEEARQNRGKKTQSGGKSKPTRAVLTRTREKGSSAEEARTHPVDAVSYLLESSSDLVWVQITTTPSRGQFSLDKDGVQPLVVTGEKFDSDWPLVTSRWGEGLNTSLSFSPSELIVQPEWVREMFPGGVDAVRSWFSSSEAVSWQVFVQAYGAWARTHHSRSVFLVRDDEATK